ncbi:hypothetical protein B0J13DRAFT_627192 [Dactylonectria estremocensis]|uniref:Uncharacterized protein n=1 Tax=Dactylonectria estremocensis TaxID=1079267 RepID=A0A9P9E1I0_9HYPO|nr:hypothetical protein B0J13DRAFT_627192 [Dactylonectria estremocensis]
MEAATTMETETDQLHSEARPRQLPPFSGCLLQSQPPLQDNSDEARHHQAQRQRHCESHLLFPTSYLTSSNDIAAPRPDAPDSAFNHWIEQELDLERLTKVQSWLFLVGRPDPPRPLHRQLAMGRDVVVDERLDMHLVWTGGRVFLKPIPRFLLCSGFWTRCLTCHPSSASLACHCCAQPNTQQPGNQESCKRKVVRKRALGFLFSYIALLRYESDFHIAQDHHLLPKDVTWPAWSRLVREVLAVGNIYQHVDPRFIYGELRLSRLNKLYRLMWPFFMSGYIRVWQRYDDYWHQSFALLTSVTVYIAIVLTAMQVGLATFQLGDNRAFHAAAYGFTVFAILGPLIFAAMALILFFVMLMDNWVTTKANLNSRMKAIKLAV